MSVQAMAWVIEKSEHKLGSLIVLLMIANHAKSDGTDAWPAIKTIAREARMSESQVHRCIARLRRSGELCVQVSEGPRGTNLYSLPKMLQRNLVEGRNLEGVAKTSKTQAEMTPEPSLTVLKEKESAQSSRDEFEAFYEQYPRKLGKLKAQRAWVKNFCEGHLAEILVSLAAWKELPQWSELQFVPYPATWLNEKLFREIPSVEVSRKGSYGNIKLTGTALAVHNAKVLGLTN